MSTKEKEVSNFSRKTARAPQFLEDAEYNVSEEIPETKYGISNLTKFSSKDESIWKAWNDMKELSSQLDTDYLAGATIWDFENFLETVVVFDE